MAEARTLKAEAGRQQDSHELGEQHDAINQHYRSINDLLARSHSTFQKLYNRKEKVLIEVLHKQFQTVSKELQYYESITNASYIEEKCKQKREELQHNRFEMLRGYMVMTDELTIKKKQLVEATAHLQQLKVDLNNSQELLDFIREQNEQINRDRSELAQCNNNEPLFPTEPVKYMSPYSIQTIAREGKAVAKKHKPRYLQPFASKCTADPILQSVMTIYQDKYRHPSHSSNQAQFALEILDLKDVRQLMMTVLQD